MRMRVIAAAAVLVSFAVLSASLCPAQALAGTLTSEDLDFMEASADAKVSQEVLGGFDQSRDRTVAGELQDIVSCAIPGQDLFREGYDDVFILVTDAADTAITGDTPWSVSEDARRDFWDSAGVYDKYTDQQLEYLNEIVAPSVAANLEFGDEQSLSCLRVALNPAGEDNAYQEGLGEPETGFGPTVYRPPGFDGGLSGGAGASRHGWDDLPEEDSTQSGLELFIVEVLGSLNAPSVPDEKPTTPEPGPKPGPTPPVTDEHWSWRIIPLHDPDPGPAKDEPQNNEEPAKEEKESGPFSSVNYTIKIRLIR